VAGVAMLKSSPRKRLVLVAAAAVLAAAWLDLWSQQKPELQLLRTDAIPVSERLPRYLMVPPHCDTEGNSYLRLAKTLAQTNAPVVKISPTGKVLARFSLDAVQNHDLKEGAKIRDFAVDARQRVHLLLSADAKAFVVVLAVDGEFEKTLELVQPNFFPTQLVVFSSGNYLVSGMLRTDTTGPATGRLFSAVFDGSGQLVKEIILPPGTSAEERIPISAEPGAGMVVPEGISYARIFQAAEVRRAAAGDGDNAYVLVRTSPPTVCVVAPDGTLIRDLKIAPPTVGLLPLTPAESSGRLIIPFSVRLNPNRGESDLKEFVVYDARTGEELARYGVSRAPRGYLCCYGPSSFTFFNSTDKGLAIVRAVPR
jgi:hypothetical protein